LVNYGVFFNITFSSGNSQMYTNFGVDVAKNYKADIEYLLTRTNVLLYNG